MTSVIVSLPKKGSRSACMTSYRGRITLMYLAANVHQGTVVQNIRDHVR